MITLPRTQHSQSHKSRSVWWVMDVNACATGTRWLRCDNALASIPPHAHLGGGPVFLAQLSSTDDCSCPLAPLPCWTRSHTHTAVCIAQSVCSSSQQQQSSTVYNGCREAGTTARASGGLRAARTAPTTTNHGCNFAPMPVLQNHGLYTGCNLDPFYKPWFVKHKVRSTGCLQIGEPAQEQS
jgi:hypothetical protein